VSLITAVSTAFHGDWGKRRLPPNSEELVVSRFHLGDWIVPPVINPLFLLLLVFAVAVKNG
jgi:hypothetical protein